MARGQTESDVYDLAVEGFGLCFNEAARAAQVENLSVARTFLRDAPSCRDSRFDSFASALLLISLLDHELHTLFLKLSLRLDYLVNGCDGYGVISRAGAGVDADCALASLRRLDQLFIKGLDEFSAPDCDEKFF